MTSFRVSMTPQQQASWQLRRRSTAWWRTTRTPGLSTPTSTRNCLQLQVQRKSTSSPSQPPPTTTSWSHLFTAVKLMGNGVHFMPRLRVTGLNANGKTHAAEKKVENWMMKPRAERGSWLPCGAASGHRHRTKATFHHIFIGTFCTIRIESILQRHTFKSW